MAEKKKYCKSLDELNEEEFRRDIRQEALSYVDQRYAEEASYLLSGKTSDLHRLVNALLEEVVFHDLKLTLEGVRRTLIHHQDDGRTSFWGVLWPKRSKDYFYYFSERFGFSPVTRARMADEILDSVFAIVLKWCINHGFVWYGMYDAEGDRCYLERVLDLDAEYECWEEYFHDKIGEECMWLHDYIIERYYEHFEPDEVNNKLEVFMKSILTPFHMDVLKEGRFSKDSDDELVAMLDDEIDQALINNLDKIFEICCPE